jgi:hypothetical protein
MDAAKEPGPMDLSELSHDGHTDLCLHNGESLHGLELLHFDFDSLINALKSNDESLIVKLIKWLKSYD